MLDRVYSGSREWINRHHSSKNDDDTYEKYSVGGGKTTKTADKNDSSEDDDYYYYELEGCEVYHKDELIGVVSEILETVSHN